MTCQRSIVLVPHPFLIEALSPFEPQSSPFERAAHSNPRLTNIVPVIVHLALLVVQELIYLDFIEIEIRIHSSAQLEDGTLRNSIRRDLFSQISPPIPCSIWHEVGPQCCALVPVAPQRLFQLIPQLGVRLRDSAVRDTRAL